MSFPNEQLLVGVAWLHAALDDESVVVLDLRAGKHFGLYEARHVQGALPLSLPHALGVVDGTPDCLLTEALAQQLGALGVRPEQTVVLYDEGWSTGLTQSFWALERVGQRAVRVLDGGFGVWQAAKAPMSTGLAHPAPASHAYAATTRDERLATREWIVTHANEAQLLDARGEQEWGSGHIPGAVSCCWKEFAEEADDEVRLASAPVVEAGLDSLGLSPEAETATYCRSGARASWLYFVLRLMAWEQVRVYDGSMVDWLLKEQDVGYGIRNTH